MTRVYRNPKVYTFRPQEEKKSLEVSSGAIWFLVILILIAGLVYFFLFSSYFKIKNIYIVGAGDFENKVSDIINQNLAQKSNFFLFPTNLVEVQIAKEYPIFSKVKIYKGIPDALKVDLQTRNAVLICHSNGDDFLIDSEGIAFKGNTIPDNIAKVNINRTINLGDKVFSKNFVSFVSDLWNNFPLKTNLKITKIDVPETDYVVNVYTDKGWYAIFDTTKSAQKQIDNLVLILQQIGDQPIQYIDLRLENKIYYK